MKPIQVMGITLAILTVFVMIFGVQIWSSERSNRALQGEGDGAFVEEAFKDGPGPVNNATETASYSWGKRLQNLIHDCVRTTKRLGHRRPMAPAGVFFTLRYISVRNPSGITGIEAGTRVVCLKDEGPWLLVKAGDLEFEAKRQYLTDDLGVAGLAIRNDDEAQQAVGSYIAQQQQAIDQRSDKWKMQASRQY